MAAKFDAQMLKKHHFWFLFIAVFIGLLLAWIGLFFEVPGETASALDEQNKEKKGQTGVQAKPRALIAKYSEQVKELESNRSKMWRQAWNEQKDLYFWPAKQPAPDNDPAAVMDTNRLHYLNDPLHGLSDKQLAQVANLKFGADIPSKENVRGQFVNREIYGETYRKLIDELAPMQFRDNWETILKYVSIWKKGVTPPSEEVWLAMEDLWVQRELLTRINQVNVEAAKFACVADAVSSVVGSPGSLVDQLVESSKKIVGEDPKHRVFRSRLWRLEIQIVDENNKRILKGKLTNLTNRLQVFGVGNVLNLKVWTGDPEKNQPLPFQIEGVSVPAHKEIPIKYIAAHELPPEWPAKGIFKVEQVFDIRTVPVKRIEYFEIGKLSDRNNQLALRMSKFSEAIAARENPTSGGSGTTPGGSSSGPPSPMGVGTPIGNPMGGQFGEGSQGSAAANGKTPQHQLNRLRYIDVTDQLRRIPIGLVVVTDQTYMKDIVESIANTKMRFQTTQVEWQRFHSALSYRTGGSTSGPTSGDSDTPGPTNPKMFGSGGGPRFGSGFGPMGFPNFGFGSGSGGPDNSSQDQFSANLMELTIYGIISLYEKYEESKGGTAKQPSTPVTKDPSPVNKPKDKEPAPMPMPKEKEPAPMPKEKAKAPMTPAMKDPEPKDPKAKDPATNDPMLPNPKS